jgi:hypothetical protein
MKKFFHKLNDIDLIKLYLITFVQWIPNYAFYLFKKTKKPVHILFCTVDHYEPGNGGVKREVEKKRVQELIEEYPKLARNHRDSAGNYPKRTWFFPPHYHRFGNLKKIVSLCEKGFGEIELHLHHGKTRPDSSENLEGTIKQCIEEYSTFGIFGTENGRKRYGFIHGDWALDNSRQGKYCGVNNEIQILQETGCYADFTFPCSNKANPRMINSIYYAIDDPETPKSHNKGIRVKANKSFSNGLMMIEGPMRWYFEKFKLRILTDGICNCNGSIDKIIDSWIKTSIHVKGRPEWIVLKTHTHGAVENDVVLGRQFHYILDYLERKYNDLKTYILHYVSARELYNIIKAAEAGKNDDPEQYRDYIVKPPRYDSSNDCEEASGILKGYIQKTYNG